MDMNDDLEIIKSWIYDLEKKYNEDVSKLKMRCDNMMKVLEIYANKDNWSRTKDGLVFFTADTNGPYLAFEAIKAAKE